MKFHLLIVFVSVVYRTSAQPDKIVCYLGSWSIYREGDGAISIENIDPNRCTHLNYGFAGLNSDGSLDVPETDLYPKFTALKQKNPNLKTLIALGGWTEGSSDFTVVAADQNLRSVLADNIVNFMDQYGFDGCDFDWEFPTSNGGNSYDKDNFVELLRVVREKFDSTGKSYLLTAAVAVMGSDMDLYYNVPEISRYLDFINLMAYDMHGAYDGVTGQNAPLYAAAIDSTDNERQRCADAGVQAWIQRGADPGKLVLGLASYGRTFTLTDRNNNGLGASATVVGNPGPVTKEGGILAYYEICKSQNEGGWTVVWDDEQKVPYAYKDDQWVGYDTPDSIRIKVEYAKSNNLGGLMLWAIDMDDIIGVCGQQYPILSAVKETMGI